MNFNIVYLPKTKKHLKKIDRQYISKIFAAIEQLPKDKKLGKPLTGKLKGKFSLRVWPYRVIYSVQKENKRIIIEAIAHRKDVYS